VGERKVALKMAYSPEAAAAGDLGVAASWRKFDNLEEAPSST
jgi:hypothetical protein